MQTFRKDPIRAPKKKPAAARRYGTLLFGEVGFDQFAEQMDDDLVSFLDSSSDLFWYQQFHICQTAAKATIPA